MRATQRPVIGANTRPQSRVFRLGALVLLLATWTLLLFRLNDVPPGLQHDQMFNSLDALSIGNGNYPFYFPANFGREPLGIYPFGVTFKLLGGQHIVWGLRFTSVTWSIIALCLTITLARCYLPRIGALLAGALLAGSFWFIFNARLGLEPVVLTTLATAVIYCLNRALAGHNRRAFAVAGVIGGLAIYTYLASRGLFVLLALLLGYEVLGWLVRKLRRQNPPRLNQTAIPGLLLTLLLVVIISAPLLVYLQNRPAAADLRVGELSGPLSAVLTGDLRPLLANVYETVLAVLWSGPASLPYHYNVPGRPVLQPIFAFFFLAGLALTLIRLRRATEFLLLAALFVGLLPDFVTGADALHMRGVIALPLIFILVARGLWGAGAFLARKLPRFGKDRERSYRAWGWLAAGLLLLLVGWQVVDSSRAYFVDWAQAEPTQRIYNADFKAVAAYLDAHPTGEPVFIGTDRLVDLDSKTYLLYQPQREDVRWFPAQENLPLPATGEALYFLPTSVDALSPATALLVDAGHRFVLPGPGGQYDLVQGLRLSSDDVAQVVQQANGRSLTPVAYGGSLQLDSAGLRQQSDTIELLTHWTVIGPWPYPTPPGRPRQPIKFSASLVDAAGYKWAQSDQPSGLPFTFWRPGDAYLELTRQPLPADLPPGDYTVRLALYDDVGGMVTASSEGTALAADAAVATVEVTSPIVGTPPIAPYPVERAAGGEVLSLVGKWEPLDWLVAGVPSDLHLSWQTAQPLDTQDVHFQLQAKAADGSVLWDQNIDPLQRLPDSWPAGQVYRLTHRIAPQASTGTGNIQLEVCALHGSETLTCGIAGRPHVIDQPPLLALPQPPQHAAHANWNDQLALAGYDTAREAGKINLALYWQVENAPGAPLKRFVHAVDQDGQIVAQADDIPANGALPMPFWRAGEYVMDQVELQVPPEASVATLCVGWYQPESGQRLPVRLSSGETASSVPDHQLCLPLN